MKYEIVRKSNIKDYGIIESFVIRRKYWLIDSYYHSSKDSVDNEDYMLTRIVSYIMVGLITGLIFLFNHSTFYVPLLSLSTLFLVFKFSERFSCTKFSNFELAEQKMDELVKHKNYSNQVVKSIETDKNTIYINKF